MLIAYLVFVQMLSVWTYISNPEQSMELLLTYGAYVVLTMVMGALTWEIWYRPGKSGAGILMALAFCNVGASIAYRMGAEEMSEFLLDLFYMLFAFVAVYLFIRFGRLYYKKLLNKLCGIALPTTLFLARLLGKPVNGSYVYLGKVMVFGIVLAGYPFVVGYVMSLPQTKYRKGNVKNMSLSLFGLLIYTFILFAGCVVCNEFGLLLILGLTATVVFFIRCKNPVTKCLYSLLCLSGGAAACLCISHIRDRVQIWLDPAGAAGNRNLAAKAESVLYLFRHFKRMGWWGNGLGNLPQSYYPTLNSDHVLVTLMNDYSIIFAMLILVLGCLYVKWMMTEVPGQNVYDRYVALTSGLIVGFMLLIHVASSLGSSITAGIGYMFISEGSSVNVMLALLLAVRCAIMERQEKQYDVFKKNV